MDFAIAGLKDLLVPIDDLFPSEGNVRVHDERADRAMADSIRELGQHQPILAKRSGEIICGAGRWRALKILGATAAAAILMDDDDIQARRRALWDNRVGDLSSFGELLDEELRFLEEDGGGIPESLWEGDEFFEMVPAPTGEPPSKKTCPHCGKEL